MAAQRRLQKELAELRKNPLENISAGPTDEGNLFEWSASMSGPQESPYEGGLFSLKLTFPPEYPFKAPQARFTTPIYHPNIGRGKNAKTFYN